MPDTKTLRLRLVWVLGLNATIGLCIAISLWWLQSRGNLHSLPTHLADSAIHSVIYGTMFGLAMPYLAERFGALRFPWNWISIITSLAVMAVIATAAVQKRATDRAADIAPTIRTLQAGGATSLRAIASALNEAGIPTARGRGLWSAVQVKRTLERI